MADDKQTAERRLAEDRKRLAEEGEARVKARQEHEKNKGRPTPTQEEADLIRLGHHVELTPDGSPPDPNVGFGVTRQVEPEHRGGYQTRQSQPAQATHRPRAPADA
jgi:hypothetical protein